MISNQNTNIKTVEAALPSEVQCLMHPVRSSKEPVCTAADSTASNCSSCTEQTKANHNLTDFPSQAHLDKHCSFCQ